MGILVPGGGLTELPWVAGVCAGRVGAGAACAIAETARTTGRIAFFEFMSLLLFKT